MATEGVRLKDFNGCCRCCLLTVGPLMPIITSCLHGMLEQVIGLQVTQNDGLPQQMCSRCILKLSAAHTFLRTVKKNQETLEMVLKEGAVQHAVEELPSIIKEEDENEQLPMKTEPEELVIVYEVSRVNGSVKRSISKEIRSTPYTDTLKSEACNQLSSLDPGDASEDLSGREETHQCVQCNHSASSQEELKSHLQTHLVSKEEVATDLEETAHLCRCCGKRFHWRSSLAKHMRHQHRDDFFQCKYCDKRFAEASTLKVHLVRHKLVNWKPFRCAVCDKTFSQKSSLTRHQTTHVAVRPRHQCPDCGKSYVQKYLLKLHCAREHTPTQCSLCLKYYNGKKGIDIHMMTHKAKPSRLSETSGKQEKDSPVKNLLTDRIKMETVSVEFLCLLCLKKFQSKESLEAHLCTRDKVT